MSDRDRRLRTIDYKLRVCPQCGTEKTRVNKKIYLRDAEGVMVLRYLRCVECDHSWLGRYTVCD